MLAASIFAACSETTPETPGNDQTEEGGETPGNGTDEGVSGDVSGVWEAGSTVNVTGHITVPEGESLTIEEGVTVIFSDAGVGVNHVAIEFTVDGNL